MKPSLDSEEICSTWDKSVPSRKSNSGKLQYVGLAGSLQGRLKTHLHDRHKDSWDRFSVYLTITDSHLREVVVGPRARQPSCQIPRGVRPDAVRFGLRVEGSASK